MLKRAPALNEDVLYSISRGATPRKHHLYASLPRHFRRPYLNMDILPDQSGVYTRLNQPQIPPRQSSNFYPLPHSIPQPYSKVETPPSHTFTSPISNAFTGLSFREPLCPICKGQLYNFTAYFHNHKVFPSPPHELLSLIEKSYILKNRLQSLLVTYVTHDFDRTYLKDVKGEIYSWNEEVEGLVNEVLSSFAGYQAHSWPLGDVRYWTKWTMTQLAEHVDGIKRMEMPKGRLKALLLEFRKIWERVWVGYFGDRAS